MARIAGIDLPREKRVEIGLTYIYGIGHSTARKIVAETGVDPRTKVRDLAEGEVGAVQDRRPGDLHLDPPRLEQQRSRRAVH